MSPPEDVTQVSSWSQSHVELPGGGLLLLLLAYIVSSSKEEASPPRGV